MSTPAVAALVHESPGERVYKTLRHPIPSHADPPGSALDVEALAAGLERAEPARRA